MKKVLFVPMLALAVAWAPSALASHGPVNESGTIALPNPASSVGLGVTEILGACDPDSDVQGVDGHWIALPDGTGDGAHTAELVPGEETTDVDAYFYDADCAWIEDYGFAQNFVGAAESGDVPTGAAYVVVNAFLSLPDATFTFTTS